MTPVTRQGRCTALREAQGNHEVTDSTYRRKSRGGSRIDRDNDDGTHEIADDVAYKRLAIVNVVFVGQSGPADRDWILIDAGLPGFAGAIKRAAKERFGTGSRPAAILMTHGHFDHVGSLETLADDWETPIYAHLLEQPYLDGLSAYPPPDPGVGGGLMIGR
jgi:glyoxylase-like metal-dependent hydrolase (beta-lactamase superfamily II)